jgi:hypothetical protein
MTQHPFPSIATLAAARLKANAGKYTVWEHQGAVYYHASKRLVGWLLTSHNEDLPTVTYLDHEPAPQQVNAAYHRDNILDGQEELADFNNIILVLLQERLIRDGRMSDEYERLLHNIDTALSNLEQATIALWQALPNHYLRDDYPVERILPESTPQEMNP